jgi:hypothetical protein
MTDTNDTRQAVPHTAEPWHYAVDSYSDYIIAHDPTAQNPHGIYVAQIDHSDDGVGRFISRAQVAANARRVCAAVNACEGITTEALEQGRVRELLAILKDMTEQFETKYLREYSCAEATISTGLLEAARAVITKAERVTP